jgi:ABC-type amino acid transport substrate-binding protein
MPHITHSGVSQELAGAGIGAEHGGVRNLTTWLWAVALATGVIACALPSSAQPGPAAGSAATKRLKVGISPFEPFVFQDGEPRGFSIDLWRRVSDKLRLDFELVPHAGVTEKLAHLESGVIDVAIGGVTLTREREQVIDFTHAVHESGLTILVRVDDDLDIWDKLGLAVTSSKMGIILGFLLLIVLAGHLVWLAERGADAFSDSYNPGVFEGMYWAIVTASTVGYGDKAPVKWPGRALAALLIIISLPMFALFTAELTSALTVKQIESRIRGPEDLHNVRVGVLTGTASAVWVAQRGLASRRYEKIVGAYAGLAGDEVDAIVYDAPSLMYYAQTAGRGQVRAVGGTFAPQDLGMAVRQGSPLRERINQAILALKQEGEIARLKAEWFGAS